MKIRGLLFATLIFAVLAGVLYWSDHRKSSAEAAKPSGDEVPAILKLDENAISSLNLKKKNAPPIELAKTGSEWKITEPKPYGADQSTVTGMLSTVSALNSERLVDDKATDLKRYGLEQPSFELDVAEKDNKSQRLLLGDDTPTGNGVYAALAGDPRVFTIANYNKNSIDKSLNDLRDKRLLTVNADKVSRVEIDGKSGDIEFGRNKDAWQIVKPKPLRADNSEVGELERKLTDAKMDLSGSGASEQDAASTFAHGSPVATAKLTDESSTQELQVRKSKDAYYAKSSVVEGVYKVGNDLGEALNKKLDDFRNKKLFDFGFADPNKIEIHSGSKNYWLMRGGQDWWNNGKKMDASAVQSLISNLRDMAADKFLDSGFTAPQIEATVTSDDGKRVEKIQIAKSALGYIAKRENDPTLYQLTSSSGDDLQKAVDGLKPAVETKK
ncbi:MAG TPA: DUF4340 domain-containing protein [Candidatus Sulfotelmatobacter sp.]|nr:DUF4340 domain-containing protein [Candidatus Sulfotelmatobacter sp.]